MNGSTHPTLRVFIHLACSLGIFAASTAIPPGALAGKLQAIEISFGSTTPGSIDQPGEVDTYTFTAETGDQILIGMSRGSGDLWQRVRLYSPNGTLVRDESHPVHVEISFLAPEWFYVYLPSLINQYSGSTHRATNPDPVQPVIAAEPGTYTLLVSDGFDGSFTGSYNLYLQKLNPPSGASTIEYAQTLPGAINQPSEMDAFIFAGTAGDKLIAGMSQLSGNLWQQIRLYDPHGMLLREEKSPAHSEFTVTLPATGSYTLLVSDGFNGTFTGSYNLYLQKLNPPAEASNIEYSQTLPGAINLPAEMDAFIFSAEAGDMLIASMSQVSGNLWQQIRLYSSEGDLLREEKSPVHSEFTVALPATGSYTLLVSDGFNGTFTGSYNLFIQRINSPANAAGLAFGQTKSGSINQPAEMDVFTFSASANDQVQINMTSISGNLWQQLRLYDPSGTLVNENKAPNQAEITQALLASGEYTILCSDGFNGTFTGSYNLNLQKLP